MRFDWYGRKDSGINYGSPVEPPASISDAATSGTVYKCYGDHAPADDSRVHIQRTVVAANVTTVDHTVVKWRHRGSEGVAYTPIHLPVQAEVNDAWYAALPDLSAAAVQSMSGYQGTALAEQGVAAEASSEDVTLKFALKSGSALPNGISLNAATGALTGTPAVGTGSFTIVVSADGNADVDPIEVLVNYAIVLPVINAATPQTLTGTEATVLADQGVVATSTPSGLMLEYALKAGSTLPVGVSLNAATGALTGTPTTAGSGAFTIVVSDAAEDAADVEVVVNYEIAAAEGE